MSAYNNADVAVISKYSETRVLKTIIAFLNTTGGAIIIWFPDLFKITEKSILELLRLNLPKEFLSSLNGKLKSSLLNRIKFDKDWSKTTNTLFVRIDPVTENEGYVYLQKGTSKKEREYYMRVKGRNRKVTLETILQSKLKALTSLNRNPTKMSTIISFPDSKRADDHTFKNGYSVPVYEAQSLYAFNRIVGYLKYINRKYGNVYSRGECKLHDSLIPSLFRGATNVQAEDNKIIALFKRFLKDNVFLNDLSLDVRNTKRSRYRVEGVLQHYGATTGFLDVVDNHWVALWMGLNRYVTKIQTDKYAEYIERTIPYIDRISGDPKYINQNAWEEEIYQYVILVAVPFSEQPSIDGINETKDIIEVDLRKALPSTYLRPHAQHGLVIKRNHVITSSTKPDDFDLSRNVVGIIKIRIDRAKAWIGNGALLTQDSLIPPPGYDPGYDLLLSKYSIFKNSTLKITKFM